MVEPVLYILMRNDLPSLTAGKAIAQATHATQNFTITMSKTLSNKSLISTEEIEINRSLQTMYKSWQQQTNQCFGTTIVLGFSDNDLHMLSNEYNNFNDCKEHTDIHWIYDPEYPFIIKDKEIMKLLNSNSVKIIDTDANGCYHCVRKELTCGWIFGDKETLFNKLSNYGLNLFGK